MLEATAHAENHHFWFRGLRRDARLFLEQGLRGRRAALIVDCGAGTGRNLDWLGEFGPAVGIELTQTGLDVGRAAGRRLAQATVTRLPLANGVADVATSFDVLYCLDDDDERQAVAEMRRILKPDGLALVNVAALAMLRGSHSLLTHERRRYTPARLTTLLTTSGFTVARMSFISVAPFPFVLAKRSMERLSGARESDADLRVPIAPVNALFSAATIAEAALLRVTNLPIGTSLLCLARKR